MVDESLNLMEYILTTSFVQLCSNALYGFTGAGASPQQAVPLADSCLR